MGFDFENYDQEDIEVIKKQLKCKEIFICGIIKRCEYGFPQIILLNPLKEVAGKKYLNYEAISNIMWLTCFYLNNKIHEIENALYIKKIKEIIRNNSSFQDMMKRAHANYYFIRNIVFRKFGNSILKREGIDLSKSGIGGIREPSSIKCLHLHFCHYSLCKDNIVGYITFHLLQKKVNCIEQICKGI